MFILLVIFLNVEMRLWLRSHGTGQIFKQLTNWSRHCPFNICALFTRNLKTTRRLNFVPFLCEWTEHLNARIFNLWKIRPEPCERNLSKGWVDASDMPFHRTRLPAPTYRLGRLSNDDGDGNENGKKTTAFDWQNQKLCTCITVFCTFLCRHILFKWRFCSRRGRRCLSSLKRTQGPADAYGETACR